MIRNKSSKGPQFTKIVFVGSVLLSVLIGMLLRISLTPENAMTECIKTVATLAGIGVTVWVCKKYRIMSRFVSGWPAIAFALVFVFVPALLIFLGWAPYTMSTAPALAIIGISLACYRNKQGNILGVFATWLTVLFWCFPIVSEYAHGSNYTIIIVGVAILLLAVRIKWFAIKDKYTLFLTGSFLFVISMAVVVLLLDHNFSAYGFDMVSPSIYFGSHPSWGAFDPGLRTSIFSQALFFGQSSAEPLALRVFSDFILTFGVFKYGLCTLCIVTVCFLAAIISGLKITFKKRGLPLFLSFGTMVALSFSFVGSVLLSLGIDFGQEKQIPFLSSDLAANISMLLLAAVVVFFDRSQTEPVPKYAVEMEYHPFMINNEEPVPLTVKSFSTTDLSMVKECIQHFTPNQKDIVIGRVDIVDCLRKSEHKDILLLEYTGFAEDIDSLFNDLRLKRDVHCFVLATSASANAAEVIVFGKQLLRLTDEGTQKTQIAVRIADNIEEDTVRISMLAC